MHLNLLSLFPLFSLDFCKISYLGIKKIENYVGFQCCEFGKSQGHLLRPPEKIPS